MLETMFIIMASIILTISATNWKFHFLGENRTEAERYSIFLGLWTVTLLLLSIITESFGI